MVVIVKPALPGDGRLRDTIPSWSGIATVGHMALLGFVSVTVNGSGSSTLGSHCQVTIAGVGAGPEALTVMGPGGGGGAEETGFSVMAVSLLAHSIKTVFCGGVLAANIAIKFFPGSGGSGTTRTGEAASRQPLPRKTEYLNRRFKT